MSDSDDGIKDFQPDGCTGISQSQEFNHTPNITDSDFQREKAEVGEINQDRAPVSLSSLDLDETESSFAAIKPDSELTELGNGCRLDVANSDDLLVPVSHSLDTQSDLPENEARDGLKENQQFENAECRDFIEDEVVKSVPVDDKENEKPESERMKSKDKKVIELEQSTEKLRKMKPSTMYSDFLCAVCENSLSDPCCLCCLHAFCAKCLTVEDHKVICPTCFIETTIGSDDIGALPRISFLEKFSEKDPEIRHCEICKLMKKETVATGFCIECKDFLCQECWNGHKFTKFTLNHEVISLEDISVAELEQQSKDKDEYSLCSKHSKEELKYFCRGCKVNVCTDCILLDHQNHPCISIQDAFEQQKMAINLLLMGVDEKISDLQTEDFESDMKGVDLAEETEVKKIKSFVENIIQVLRQQESQAIATMQMKFDSLRQHGKRRQVSVKELLYHLKEVKTICGRLSAICRGEEFLALEKRISKRLVRVLNTTIRHEPLSWFSCPSVEVNSWLNDENGLKSLFKLNSYGKCIDRMEQMPCIGSLKEMYENMEISQKAGHPEWFKGNIKAFIEKSEKYNEIFENQHVQERKFDLDTLKYVSTQSESGSTATSENYDEAGARPKIISPKKKRGRKKKNTAVSMENIIQHCPMDGEMSEIQDTALQEQVPGYIELSNYFNPSAYKPLQIPGAGFFPGAGYMMNSASLNSLTNISKISRVPVGKPPRLTNQSVKPQSIEKTKPKQKSAPGENQQKKAKAATVKPVNSTVSITPKWRLDTKCPDDKEIPFLTAVHPIQQNKVVVSDSINNKIKLFSIEGAFIKSYDAQNPTSVVFVCGVLLWTSGHTVVIKEQNDEFEKVINFPKDTIAHPLSWYPQSQFAVACGDHLRIYHVDKEKQNFTKKCQISLQFPNQQKMSNIFSVKSNGNGKNIVMTDWDLKAVVIGDNEGKVVGKLYIEINTGIRSSGLPVISVSKLKHICGKF